MTTTDQAWARGSNAAITQPPIAPPAPPPIPPTYWPPAPQGGLPGGPRHPRRRWLAAAAVAVAIGAAGIGGWALRATTHTEPTPAAPAASPTPPAAALTPEQAKTQTCGAYKTLGLQWSAAYHKWADGLPHPWSWTDPAVQSATAEFDATATQVASQMAQLTDPQTPADVTAAVRDARLQIIALAASHGQTATGSDTDAQIDAVDKALGRANEVCGIGQ